MERYFKRKASCLAEDEINWDEEIQYDPGLRKEIDSYHPNLREKVRRKYLENGPCQPRGINFPLLNIGEKDKQRRFMREWFDEFVLGLNKVRQSIKHIAFIVSCLEKRKMQDMKHLLLMVGMVITGKIGYDYMLVCWWPALCCNEEV